MMSQSGTILHRKAGLFVPTEFTERMLKVNQHGWGAAMINDGKLMLTSDLEPLTAEFFQDTMKEFKDTDITVYTCSSPSGLSKEDLSPYVLIQKPVGNNEFEPQVVGFIEGDYSASAQAGSSHPPEYHFIHDYLIPKLEGVYELVEEDLDKLTEYLKKPHFRKEMVLSSVKRGVISILAANGTALTFQQNDLGAEYPWGWASNTHGYTTEMKKEEPAAPAKKPSMFSGKSTVREKVNVAPSPAIAEAVKPPATETAINSVKGYSVKKWAPSKNDSRKNRKNAYKNRLGYCPVGWEDNIEVDVYVDPQGKMMTWSQVKSLGPISLGVQQLAKNPQKESDTEVEHIPQTEVKPAQPSAGTSEVLPIVSPKAREYAHELMRSERFKKIIAENGDVINDPKVVEGYETKFADFHRQLGYKTADEFASISFEEIRRMNREDGPQGQEIIENMCFYFRNLAAKHGAINPLVKEEKAPVTSVPQKKPSMFAKAG